jgi:acyl carrier protein
VTASGAKLTAADLREFLATRLPDYMIPGQFVAIAALPMTPNGKLDKAALPEPAAENLLPSGAPADLGVGPGDGLQQKLAALVASLVGQPSVAAEDNFFMIGGHSMLAVQLVARIHDLFGVKLTLRQLFNAPTVAALSVEVGRLQETRNA